MNKGGPHGFSGCSIPAIQSQFYATFLKIVVEVKASGQPDVLTLWLG